MSQNYESSEISGQLANTALNSTETMLARHPVIPTTS